VKFYEWTLEMEDVVFADDRVDARADACDRVAHVDHEEIELEEITREEYLAHDGADPEGFEEAEAEDALLAEED
jgi:hypothetical protein